MSRVYLPVRAQCTQCSLPSTRNPVSSNPATSLAAIWLQEPVQPPGRAGGQRRDRPGGQRDAGQLRHRQRGPLLRQELPGVQVNDDRGDPRPVLNRGLYAPGLGGTVGDVTGQN
jgi:hypothetical protein